VPRMKFRRIVEHTVILQDDFKDLTFFKLHDRAGSSGTVLRGQDAVKLALTKCVSPAVGLVPSSPRVVSPSPGQ
jgi:hypothetical protein